MFVTDYIPDNFLREIVLAKGNANLLYLYYAVLSGLKPLMDDWVPTSRITIFEKACRKYGLHIFKESIFIYGHPKEVEKSIGKDHLTTTKVFGAPVSSNYDGDVHVFVSKSKQVLDEGKKYGWYPESVNGRIIPKPHLDHYRFGEFLGYPKCCRNFFMEYNDHSRYPNTLYLPFINTKSPHFLCNSLTKDSYSYIYHIPCSFDCKKTIQLASKLRKIIYDRDSAYAELIDKHLKMVFLVLKEKNIYAFNGELINNEVIYDRCYFVDYMLYPAEYLKLFKKGNRIKVSEEEIKVFLNKKLVGKVSKTNPECGFLISFKGKHE